MSIINFASVGSLCIKCMFQQLKFKQYKHGRRNEFFQGGPLGDFSKFFSRGAKSGKICFFPLKTKKTTFFATNFKIHGGQVPTSDAHEYKYSRFKRKITQILHN